MARPPNTDLFLPDQFYHIYNHAVGEDNLFRRRDNYLYFLNRLRYYLLDVCHCFAYYLMPNHFHFLVQVRAGTALEHFRMTYKPDQANVPAHHTIVMNQLSRMLNGYTQAYNKMFDRKGALFLDNTRRKQVTDPAYLVTLVSYIHHNPVRHVFCEDISDWEFSSYQSLCSSAPTQVAREALLALFDRQENFEQAHRNSQVHHGITNEFEF
ncbi:hypothetical protein [Taibaiella koreensis]|uniref:hypothetical protein n=1 Tax=Taibaiella koreensis TaxID=1268548 RepID=UPI000E59DA53|nr:hypothetical protein [Taibaiella koreensis]